MGVGSQVGDPADLFWRYTYATFIQVENFSYQIPAGHVIEIICNLTNSAATSIGPFIIRTFWDNGDDPIKMKNEQLNAGSVAKRAWGGGGTLMTAAQFKPGNMGVMYHDVQPIRDIANETFGPLRIIITPTQTHTANVGYVQVTIDADLGIPQANALPTPGDALMRCTWENTATGAVGLGSAATMSAVQPYVFQCFAPQYINIGAGTEYLIYITTLYADGKYEGIEWKENKIRYELDIEEHPDGSATVVTQERRYNYMEPVTIPRLEIISEHGTPGEYTRWRMTFNTDASWTVPAYTSGGRIVIEVPTDTGYFANDLGLGIADNGVFPCQLPTLPAPASTITGTVKCYLQLGGGDAANPAKIYVTGFNQINPGTIDCQIHFPKIYNPAAGDDNILVYVNVYFLDTSQVAFKDQKIAYRRLYVNRIRQDIKTTHTMGSDAAISVTGNDIRPSQGTYDIDVRSSGSWSTADEDVYVVEFPPEIYHQLDHPNCTAGCSTCTYYHDTNTLYCIPNGGSKITITNVENPPSIFAVPTLQFYAHVFHHNECNQSITY